MLEVALEKAQKRGIHNVETVVCDVCELPFANLTFDAVTCRFGFMFFPDMQLAAAEMLSVLKPGGKLTTTVWGMPEKNSWVTIIANTIQQYMPSPPPKPEAPGMFRCAQQGLLLQLLQNAGLKNGIETAINSVIHCGTAEVFWNMMTEIAAPFAAALNKADADLYQTIKSEVIAQLHQKYTPNAVMIHTSAWVKIKSAFTAFF
jgi:ubiquinone/menaquinone biosynthesis C-methylase UbiE